LLVLYLLMLSVMMSAVQAIFNAALYRYACFKQVPAAFDANLVKSIWTAMSSRAHFQLSGGKGRASARPFCWNLTYAVLRGRGEDVPRIRVTRTARRTSHEQARVLAADQGGQVSSWRDSHLLVFSRVCLATVPFRPPC